jgi:putative transposase
VSENRAAFPIGAMCRVLGVSPSGYHAWRKRAPSARAREDAALSARVIEIHAVAHGTYGAPRIHAELRDDGMRVGRKRVARLMTAAGIAGVSRRKFVATTQRDGSRPAPDLVDRNFSADAPNTLWVADITYIPTWAGFLYLAVVLDVFSRKIVGWSMATTLHVDVVLAAMNMALAQRRPTDVIHHSDQSSQYTSFAFGKRCREAGVRPSIGSVGDAYDNAMAESFFATLECELIDRSTFRSHAEARMAAFRFIASASSKASTIRSDGIRRWAISRLSTSRQLTRKSATAVTPLRPDRTSKPPCSRPSRTSPPGARKRASLTAAARDGHRRMRAGTKGWTSSKPNKRMAA